MDIRYKSVPAAPIDGKKQSCSVCGVPVRKCTTFLAIKKPIFVTPVFVSEKEKHTARISKMALKFHIVQLK